MEAGFDLIFGGGVWLFLIGVCFVGLFGWSRAQCKKGRKISYWPLAITIFLWFYSAYEIEFELPKYGCIGQALSGSATFLVLIMATGFGLIPWFESWFRVRAREKRGGNSIGRVGDNRKGQ